MNFVEFVSALLGVTIVGGWIGFALYLIFGEDDPRS